MFITKLKSLKKACVNRTGCSKSIPGKVKAGRLESAQSIFSVCSFSDLRTQDKESQSPIFGPGLFLDIYLNLQFGTHTFPSICLCGSYFQKSSANPI